MRLVSPLLKHVIYPGLAKSGYFDWTHRRHQPIVITYHGILPPGYLSSDPALDGHLISAISFRAQLKLLRKKYSVIRPDEFRLWLEGRLTLPPRAVLLTCDDGLMNVLTEMLPVLDEMHLRCLFFITGAALAASPSMLWHEQLYLLLKSANGGLLRLPGEPPIPFPQSLSNLPGIWQQLIKRLSVYDQSSRAQILDDIRIQLGISEGWQSEYSGSQSALQRFFMMTREQVAQLADDGMTIGAHTLSHPMLSSMSRADAGHEIAGCKTQLEGLLGIPLWPLAFPFGTEDAAGPREGELAREAGFTCSFMNIEFSEGRFAFPRIHVSAGMTLAEFEAHISGFDRALRLRYRAAAGESA